jgi:hypothetical protein
MEICHHNIDAAQIIGIGPLMTEHKPDVIYPTARYYFMLHCRQQSIRIDSDAVVKGDFNPDKEKDIAYLKDFLRRYNQAKEKIIEMLNSSHPLNAEQYVTGH